MKSTCEHISVEPLGSGSRAGPFMHTCDAVSLELGYSARNHTEWDAVQAAHALLHQAPIEPDVTRRALKVQGLLARRGHHRVALPDLVIAAAAERAGVAVLHYDRDYETIAEETGQDVEWVVPPGSVS